MDQDEIETRIIEDINPKDIPRYKQLDFWIIACFIGSIICFLIAGFLV